jgi:hypothetical protein
MGGGQEGTRLPKVRTARSRIGCLVALAALLFALGVLTYRLTRPREIRLMRGAYMGVEAQTQKLDDWYYTKHPRGMARRAAEARRSRRERFASADAEQDFGFFVYGLLIDPGGIGLSPRYGTVSSVEDRPTPQVEQFWARLVGRVLASAGGT